MATDKSKQSHGILNLQKQLKILYWRIQTSSYTSEEPDMFLSLSSHISQLQNIDATDNITKELSSFSESLQASECLAACFLTQFLHYVESTLEITGNLDTVKEIIDCLLPCVHTAMKRIHGKEVVKKICKNNLLLNIYKCLVNAFTKESQYQNGAVTDLFEYQSNSNKTVKAHIKRMNSGDSKKLFQETFGDCGNIAELYLIYVWQIYMIYEVKEDNAMLPSLHCITEVMENSGKYIMVVPPWDMNKMSLTNPSTPAGRYYNSLRDGKMLEAPHPIPDLAFEWTDFRIGVLHPNGVVFLINSGSWEDCLKEISATIEGLEVKRSLTFLPSLGSTFGLALKVRVFAGLGCHVSASYRVIITALIRIMNLVSEPRIV